MREDVKRAKLNIKSTLIKQLIATACGIMIPRIMINAFGSVMYGIVTSITQFLSYISLLEGGISSVARGALYKPLAEGDSQQAAKVYYAAKRFFGIVGIIFIGYTIVLSLSYHGLVREEVVDHRFIFALVWIISITVMAKYFGGLANLTLLTADQKQYVANIVISATTIANVLLIYILVQKNCSLMAVKLCSGLIFLIQPVAYGLYVRKNYKILTYRGKPIKLQQRWTGMGQHIALCVHRNTDVFILTLFADISLVAVYTVYKMIVSSIYDITRAFTGGMEAIFGEMIAKNEEKSLQGAFRNYKFMLSSVAVVLFGTTAVLINHFVRLYMAGVRDANYIQPVFAAILLLAEALDCMALPCSLLPVAANKLKESRWGSYGEAAINVSVSLILMRWNPLVGIALGTLCATIFKYIYYMIYSSRCILKMRTGELAKYFIYSFLAVGVFAVIGMISTKAIIPSFAVWTVWGFVTVAAVFLITVIMSRIFYPNELNAFKYYLRQSYARKTYR